jgi:hypothetical protein
MQHVRVDNDYPGVRLLMEPRHFEVSSHRTPPAIGKPYLSSSRLQFGPGRRSASGRAPAEERGCPEAGIV